MLRFLKQFIYGVLFLAVAAGGGYLAYQKVFYVAPSCFDNIHNQLETDVDCGPILPGSESLVGSSDAQGVGVSCMPCELKRIKLGIGTPKVFSLNETTSTVIIELNNSSLNYGLKKFGYTVKIFDKASGIRLRTKAGESSIFPGEKKYLAVSGIDVDRREIGKVDFEIIPELSLADWSPRKAMPAKPNVMLTDTAFISEGMASYIGGFINNNSPSLIRSVNVVGFGYGISGEIARASSAPFENIAPFSKVPFRVFIQDDEYSKVEAHLDLAVQ